jgi:hypothetical protein
MKKFILILLTFSVSFQLNGQRNLMKVKDPYTGIESRSTDYELVGIVGRSGSIKCKLTEYIDKDTAMRLDVSISRLTSRCLGPESKMLIKSGSVTITVKLSGQNLCDKQFEDYGMLSLEEIKFLKQNRISGITVYYLKGFDNFDVENIDRHGYDLFTENKSDYFISTLKYFKK